jgi:hypothetical protein
MPRTVEYCSTIKYPACAKQVWPFITINIRTCMCVCVCVQAHQNRLTSLIKLGVAYFMLIGTINISLRKF